VQCGFCITFALHSTPRKRSVIGCVIDAARVSAGVRAWAALMKLSHKARWFAVAGGLFAVIVLAIFLQAMSVRPGFQIGSSTKEVLDYVQAEQGHHRRLPPFEHMSAEYSRGAVLMTTEFFFRSNHVFATHYVTAVLSNNGMVSSMDSRWKWTWSL
jgi:hypothetical protein